MEILSAETCCSIHVLSISLRASQKYGLLTRLLEYEDKGAVAVPPRGSTAYGSENHTNWDSSLDPSLCIIFQGSRNMLLKLKEKKS